MKIALLGSKDFDSLEYHINDSLTFLKHQVFHIDIKDVVNIPYRFNYWARKLSTIYDEKLFNRIADSIISFEPDLVICTYRFIHPITISKIKKNVKNVKIVHLNPDQLTTLEHGQIFASDYDFYFTKDKFILSFMKDKANLNAFNLPEAFNPRVHKPFSGNKNDVENSINIDVVAFGNMYPYRAKFLSEIMKAGIDLTLFGGSDKRFPRKEIVKNFRNEYITGDRKAEILTGSKIVLNNFHYAEIYSANAKFFEIGGIGAFQICDYKPVLQEYVPFDIEQITFKTLGEAVEKINYFLLHEDLRYSICKQFRNFALEHHTYEIRMQQMLDIIFK